MHQSQAEAAANVLRDGLKAMFPNIDIEVRELDRDEKGVDSLTGVDADPDPLQAILDVLSLPLSGYQRLALISLCASAYTRMNNERAAFLLGVSVEEWGEVIHQLAGLGYVMKADNQMLINTNCIAANVRALPEITCSCGNTDCRA